MKSTSPPVWAEHFRFSWILAIEVETFIKSINILHCSRREEERGRENSLRHQEGTTSVREILNLTDATGAEKLQRKTFKNINDNVAICWFLLKLQVKCETRQSSKFTFDSCLAHSQKSHKMHALYFLWHGIIYQSKQQQSAHRNISYNVREF